MLPVAVALAVLAVWIWPGPRSPCDRLHALLHTSTGSSMRAAPFREPGHRETASKETGSSKDRSRIGLRGGALAAGVAVVTFLIVGGVPGAGLAVLLAIAVVVVAGRREPTELRLRRERMMADLPFAADLMAACSRAGQPLGTAVDTAARAVGGPLGERLSFVSGQVRLGADSEAAWSVLAEERALASLARTVIRAAQGGTPIGDALTRLADDMRHAARAASSAAARRVGVQAVAPLGLCFLPAFVFLGIIPVVAGLASQVLVP